MVVPKTPENPPKIRYKIPISLWFVENNQRDEKEYTFDNIDALCTADIKYCYNIK
jgi:hypothetical protein